MRQAVEYAARWLEAGQRASWAVRVAPDSRGRSLVLRTAFFGVGASAAAAAAAAAATDAADVAYDPAADEAAAASGDGNGHASDGRRDGCSGGGDDASRGTEVTAQTIEGEHAGSFEATEAGALVLCLDNHSAWWNAVRVSVELNVTG